MNQDRYTPFIWSDKYSVGIDQIDSQHKILFELINRLFQVALRREHESSITEIIDTLIDYTRTHFELEEKLLQEASYPELAEHHQEHQRFVEELESVACKFLLEEKIVTFKLLNFLKHWLKEHILVTDIAYARALASSGFSTNQWDTHARTVMEKKNSNQLQQPWWKFWA